MYIVTLNNNGRVIPIHNNLEKLKSGKITKGISTIDSFQFSMLPSNAGFDEIYDYVSLVSVYNTARKRYDFYGRVLYSEDTMDEDGSIQKDVICENYFGFLCDSQQEFVAEKLWAVEELLNRVLNLHNSLVEEYKHFSLGEVTAIKLWSHIHFQLERESTWDTLNRLADEFGGEIRFRVEDGKIYLDWLAELGKVSSTGITLSRNMKSVSREKDPSEIVTRLIPLGCKQTEKDAEGNDVESEIRLDISSVNGGKKYIDDEIAKAVYGIRVKTVEFDDVTSASTLKTRGESWLAGNNKVKVKYTATALELSLLGLDVDDFDVANYHPLKNPLLGIDDTVRIIKKSIDIIEEVKSTIEFGDNFETLTESTRRLFNILSKQNIDLAADVKANYVLNTRLRDEIEKTTSLIEQTESRILLEVTAQHDDFSETVSALEVTVGKIDARVTQTNTVLGERMTTAESSLTLLSNEIKTKVETTEFNKLGDKVSKAESTITQHSNEISLKVSQTEFDKLGERVETAEGELSLKIGRDENGQIISMINASADVIELNSNRLIINSDNFSLAAEGVVTAKAIEIVGGSLDLTTKGGNRVVIGEDWDEFHVCSEDYDGYSGTSLGFDPWGIIFADDGSGVRAINFGLDRHKLVGIWAVDNFSVAGGSLTIGNTTLAESDLQSLLALI